MSQKLIADYLEKVIAKHKTGDATEHTYRSSLEWLFDSVADDIHAINEPKAVKVGRPDFVINRGEMTIGWCEAKDLGLDINPKAMNDTNKAQFNRYAKALPNLIYTNCLDFRFYRDGELVDNIAIAEFLMGVQPKPDRFEALFNRLKDFTEQTPQTITSAKSLAERMAGKSLLIKDILFNSLIEDKDLETELTGQFKAFKEQLIHDLEPEDFADIYSETIAYGMFAARLHDETPSTFSREEALDLLPKSNPFLRNLFAYIAGPNLDERIKRAIDELAAIFKATDLHRIFEDFGKFTQRNDPFIHFYETFLAEYNPGKRKARGVWYTPEPVVNFIVRAVDEVLKTEFGLPMGLADTSKVTLDWDTGQPELTKDGKVAKSGKNIIEKKEVHRVQILDPATGTGTFLAEVIKQIAPKIKNVAEGKWSQYVEKELIPRLHGFELLMASYAMCHMKLDMMLTELGYKPTGAPPRLGVYLTNSLEEGESVNQALPFANWLSNESRLANSIKNDMPIMCVIGNPPYSGISQNMGEWISSLIEDYKYVDGKHFGERKHWLHDDYVKFIRLSEKLIEKNGEGILGLITNHGYLDNPTFRGMRWHLLKTFDKIWVLDLHGNSKKKEVAPDGCTDQNVFDIQQGVSVIIAAKKGFTGNSEMALAQVWHGDLWGSRKQKYEALWAQKHDALSQLNFSDEDATFAFVPRDFENLKQYNGWFSLPEIFESYSSGVVTSRDGFVTDDEKTTLIERVTAFIDPEIADHLLRSTFGLKDNYQWKLPEQRHAIGPYDDKKLEVITYRPFDDRWIYYDDHLVFRPRRKAFRHIREHENLGISFNRNIEQKREFSDIFVFDKMIQHHSLSLKEVNYLAPL